MSLPDSNNPLQRITLTSDREDRVTTFSTGFNLTGHKGYQVRLQYEGAFGAETENHSGSVKVEFEF